MSKAVTLLVFDGFRNDSRVLKEALSLQAHGFFVRVVGSQEDDLQETESKRGIPVVRLKTGTGHNGLLARLCKYLRYYVGAACLCRKDAIVQCNDLLTLPVALFLRFLRGRSIRIIYDAHEYETETNWLKGNRQKLAKLVERALIRLVNRVITVSESIADAYVADYGITRPLVVLNSPPLSDVTRSDILRQELGIPAASTIFLYQGGLSANRGIELLLEAFQGFGPEVALVFLGYGALEPFVREWTKSHENVYWHEAVPFEQLLAYTASADFGLSLIENSCKSYYYCLPNKLFEYAMAGLPVLVSNLYEMERTVRESGIGLVTEENTPESFRKTVRRALEIDRDMFIEPLRVFSERYNWNTQEQTYLAAFSAD